MPKLGRNCPKSTRFRTSWGHQRRRSENCPGTLIEQHRVRLGHGASDGAHAPHGEGVGRWNKHKSRANNYTVLGTPLLFDAPPRPSSARQCAASHVRQHDVSEQDRCYESGGVSIQRRCSLATDASIPAVPTAGLALPPWLKPGGHPSEDLRRDPLSRCTFKKPLVFGSWPNRYHCLAFVLQLRFVEDGATRATRARPVLPAQTQRFPPMRGKRAKVEPATSTTVVRPVTWARATEPTPSEPCNSENEGSRLGCRRCILVVLLPQDVSLTHRLRQDVIVEVEGDPTQPRLRSTGVPNNAEFPLGPAPELNAGRRV